MNTDNVVARLRAMADNARCRECGSTVVACAQEADRDPKGPMRCCERCGHGVSVGAARALAREVESGEVAPPKEPTARKTGMSWFDYLNQGEVWRPNGKPPVPVADMDPEWRYNAARWLESGCARIGWRYMLAARAWLAVLLSSPLGPSDNAADSIERDIDDQAAAIERDPVAWIRTTVLYRALVADLPTEGKDAEALAERARHWGACPVRTGSDDCRCEQIRAEHAAREAVLDTTPEWTR